MDGTVNVDFIKKRPNNWCDARIRTTNIHLSELSWGFSRNIPLFCCKLWIIVMKGEYEDFGWKFHCLFRLDDLKDAKRKRWR